MVDLSPAERAVLRYRKDITFSNGIGSQWKDVDGGRSMTYTASDSGIKYNIFQGEKTDSTGKVYGHSLIVRYYRLRDPARGSGHLPSCKGR